MIKLEDSVDSEGSTKGGFKDYCYKCIAFGRSFKGSLCHIRDMKKSHYVESNICVDCFNKEVKYLASVGGLKEGN